MKSEEKLGSVKRFGARYGRKVKIKYSKIEREQRRLHKCPYCSKINVKRIAMGIWYCKKCDSKFTGKAYTLSKKIVPKDAEQAKDVTKFVEEENNEDTREEAKELIDSEEDSQEESEAVRVPQKNDKLNEAEEEA
jgi:large subunit ribosomal protein L37Ae